MARESGDLHFFAKERSSGVFFEKKRRMRRGRSFLTDAANKGETRGSEVPSEK
jgi:hypothetical protein